MSNYGSIMSIIEDALALDVANPNLAISTKEALLRDKAIRLGSLDYFRYFPMRIRMMAAYNSGYGTANTFNYANLYTPRMEDGNVVIPFEDFFTRGSPKVPQDQLHNTHFLGITRIDRPAWQTWSNPGTWDLQMLGVQLDNTNYDYTKTLLSNTLDELSTGQPQYQISRISNEVLILVPYGFGQISIYAAIGFSTPEYVEYSKVDYVCKFISYRFIESIIQARDGVRVDADFTISTEALERRLEKLKAEVDSIRDMSVLSMAQWS